MKMLRLISPLLIAALLWAPPAAAADGEPPVDFVTVNADGTLAFDPSRLTPAGILTIPPPAHWDLPAWKASLPGTGLAVCLGCLTFNTYSTASGQTVVVPTAYTAVLMALRGESPFDATPDYAVVNGALGLAAYTRAFEGMGIDPDEVSDLSRWRLDPRFWLQLNAALNDPRSPLNQGGYYWAAGLFVFPCRPASAECVPPEPQPTPASPPGSSSTTAAATPVPSRCPPDLQVTASPPAIEARKLAPPFPVVVGQDPEKRGVDLGVLVTIPPVIASYNEEVPAPEHRCDWVGPGKGTGCPRGSYDNTSWQAWMAGNDWEVVDVAGFTCERRTVTYPDRIRSLRVTAELTSGSIAWIEGDLAARYPGARVYQANWPLYPGLAPSAASVSPDGTQLAMTWESVQFRDPGNYFVTIQGTTAGTPYTAPRVLSFREVTFGVDLVVVGLTK